MKLDGYRTLATGLVRPESVICTASGDVFCSHKPGVVMHIAADGRSRAIGRRPDGVDFIPNGICLRPDGTILVANVGTDGGIWKLGLDESVTPFLMEADGQMLSAANYAGLDEEGRIWISVSTRTTPRNDVYNRRIADGYLVLMDRAGARIVADGLEFTNESRLSGDGRHLYVNETAGRRVTRYTVGANGDLTGREVFAEFGSGSLPDGCEFDAEGHFWVACVVSNRLIRIAPDGRQEIVFEDTTPEHVAKVDAAIRAGTVATEHFYEDAGTTVRSLTSLAFGGSDLRKIHLGSLVGSSIATFRAPVAGRRPVHWNFTRPFDTAA